MSIKQQLFCTVMVVLIIRSNCSIVYHLDAIRNIKNSASEFKVSDQVITCSTWLARLIDDICNNLFKIVKRHAPENNKSPEETRRAYEQWQRTRRQVASECCEKPCSVANLLLYCPSDAVILKEHPELFY